MTTPELQQASPYTTLDLEGVRTVIASLPAIAARLGGTPAEWRVWEVSDGNLNMVFVAEGPEGGVCLKQALPHVRVDPAWKMPLDRTFFEAAYLRAVFPHVPDLTTECLHFDPEQVYSDCSQPVRAHCDAYRHDGWPLSPRCGRSGG
ncbi:hypothetical protein [Acetobacter cerevisiae]|uniref:hypothetical protein n=1 Tax=Acetobacter cerevisiae TaxID=178900 RepID=UPI000ADA0962|nr:hypothetical protein [Acetobacter cerevisiae]